MTFGTHLVFGLKTEDVTGVFKKCVMRGVIFGLFRRIHLLLWASPSFVAQWGGCYMSYCMTGNLRCVVAFISIECWWILFVLLRDERRWTDQKLILVSRGAWCPSDNDRWRLFHCTIFAPRVRPFRQL